MDAVYKARDERLDRNVGDQPAAVETWTKLAEDRNCIGSPTWSLKLPR